MSDIVVLDYDPRWLQLFETLRAAIWRGVEDIAISIEHVGSTSVPGLAAKPIIDMDVVVAEGDVAAGIVRLAALGYEHQGDLGIPLREAFRNPPGSPPHHLYLCPSNSLALANHLAIRDYLRRNPAAVQAYGTLKKRLAREHAGDIGGYVQAKTEFLVTILSDLGFEQASVADIESMNRRNRMGAV